MDITTVPRTPLQVSHVLLSGVTASVRMMTPMTPLIIHIPPVVRVYTRPPH